MFREALKVAGGFTYPVVMSRLSVAGDCSASMGAFVLVNDEGWIVTAGHILEQIEQLQLEVEAVTKHQDAAAMARAIPSLKERSAALKKLGQLDGSKTRRFSVWWGGIANELEQGARINAVDLGVAKLKNADCSAVASYPRFKDPTKDFEPGTSLCKLGFPFHSFTPIWDEAKGAFTFPDEAFPIPRFPLEGIFTRIAELRDNSGNPAPFPLMWVETSSPGLKGQSGGPTVDASGSIWAIQCKTRSLALGFSPDAPDRKGTKEHQFLNVGVGVHPTTIFGLFATMNVKHQVTSY